MPNADLLHYEWRNTIEIRRFSFQCGYCGDKVGAHKGYETSEGHSKSESGRAEGYPVVIICPTCNRPNCFASLQWQAQTPAPVLGRPIVGLPSNIADLYDEARACTKIAAYTSCILACRKLLMHLAVEHGAAPKMSFMEYVEYLSDNNWIPPKSKSWVDRIRKKGNEANHEIVLMTEEDAKEILFFIEMLLRFMFEFADQPAQVQAASAS